MNSQTISRRRFMMRCGAGTLAMTGMRAFADAASPAAKPNVVFILIDDMGWSDLACYGNAFHETPHIDRLAQQGMRFTNAYAACPVCSPTRASIIAGQYPARVGITDFIPGHYRPYAKLDVPVNRQQFLPLEAVTIAEALKTVGYTTASVGKWHLGGREYFPDRQGFDDMLVADGRHFDFKTTPPGDYGNDAYLAEVLTDRALEFIETHREDPFFLYLAHFAVHIPLEARKELIAKYEQKPKPPTGVNNPVYAAMVEHVDQSVGRVLAKLDELELTDGTLVVFFSDNGGLRQRFDGEGPLVTTNAPLRAEKGTLYEGGIREPLIIRWPGVVRAQSTCNVPVSSVDFYPTLLDACGAKADPAHILDGESITPLLRGDGAMRRDALYWHYPVYHHSTPAGAIRQGSWKLIEFFEDNHVELYNLDNDIGEEHDLAAEMPERAQTLRDQLAAWRQSVNAAMPKPNPNYDPARAGEWGRRP
ncbi:MAG TPA: sulfatase [Candidatus Hydrogenedentes bacterium]|nr:sulfatase [Candidatus Hydrogenedentota bacterium]HPG65804.1 sulfatase [Candidatus Hydrogenedentota bacterium]